MNRSWGELGQRQLQAEKGNRAHGRLLSKDGLERKAGKKRRQQRVEEVAIEEKLRKPLASAIYNIVNRVKVRLTASDPRA